MLQCDKTVVSTVVLSGLLCCPSGGNGVADHHAKKAGDFSWLNDRGAQQQAEAAAVY